MSSETIYLLFWKPETGLPVLKGHHTELEAAVSQMDALVSTRTTSGDWTVLRASAPAGSASRDVLLRSRAGLIESFYISEHHGSELPTASTPTGVV